MASKFRANVDIIRYRIIEAAELLRRYAVDSRGATAIEYGLIVGGISVAIVAVVFNLGEELENLFQGIMNDFQKR